MQELLPFDSWILIAVSSTVASFFLTWLATRYAVRNKVLDVPGARSSHERPVPRGGGAGIIAACALGSLLLLWLEGPNWWHQVVLPGFLILSIIGWIDDHRSLSAKLRFAVQFAVSLLLLSFFWSQGLVSSVPAAFVVGAAVLWTANLYNFMDGSDGMAGVQGVYCGLLLACLFHRGGDVAAVLASLLLAASCLGFLPWNVLRARVFMGDVASVPLGFAFGALLTYGVISGAFHAGVGLLVLAVFLVDTTLTLSKRIIRGERWYTAHRQHLYQQLIRSGWTHLAVMLLYQSINIMLVLPAIIISEMRPELAWPLASGTLLIMVGGWYIATRRLGVTA